MDSFKGLFFFQFFGSVTIVSFVFIDTCRKDMDTTLSRNRTMASTFLLIFVSMIFTILSPVLCFRKCCEFKFIYLLSFFVT